MSKLKNLVELAITVKALMVSDKDLISAQKELLSGIYKAEFNNTLVNDAIRTLAKHTGASSYLTNEHYSQLIDIEDIYRVKGDKRLQSETDEFRGNARVIVSRYVSIFEDTFPYSKGAYKKIVKIVSGGAVPSGDMLYKLHILALNVNIVDGNYNSAIDLLRLYIMAKRLNTILVKSSRVSHAEVIRQAVKAQLAKMEAEREANKKTRTRIVDLEVIE